jgi:hypothetical protein
MMRGAGAREIQAGENGPQNDTAKGGRVKSRFLVVRRGGLLGMTTFLYKPLENKILPPVKMFGGKRRD